MLTKFMIVLASLSTVLVLSACGSGDDALAALGSASAPVAPAAAPAKAAQASAGVPMFSTALQQGSSQRQADSASPAQAAEHSGDGARVIAWEQSYSLEMHRRHEEQLALAKERKAADQNGASEEL